MKRGISVFFILLALSSCTEFDPSISGSRPGAYGPKVVFRAATEVPAGPETKVYADENMKVLWNAEDRISIFNMTTFNSRFQFMGEDGDTAGEFEDVTLGEVEEGEALDYVYAVYPYHKTHTIDSRGVLTVSLLAQQTWKEHSFGRRANTMVAVTDANFLAFRNVGGYLSLRLYGEGLSVSKITIQGNNGEKIAGKAAITCLPGGTPSVTMDDTATESITLVCDPPVKLGSTADQYTDFWFVIPPVTFTKGFTITVVDGRGGTFTKKTTKSFTVNRNQLDWMNPLKVVPDYTDAFVEFDDEAFRAYCIEHFDKDGDGEVSIRVEADTVKRIEVNTETIASLKGLESFPGLTSLTCKSEDNQGLLESLDVSGNPKLSTLICSGNQLTALDLSQNTALGFLWCSNNALTELDLTNNSSLSSLYCDSNRLAALTVKGKASLRRIVCSNNQLTELNLTENPALYSVYCENNRLTTLDLSDLPALSSLNCDNNSLVSLNIRNNAALGFLYCGDNQLASLDVSNNVALKTFNCSSNLLSSLDISKNTALTTLFCYQNQLTSLDVSKNTLLEGLYCGDNQLTSLDVSNNLALTSLYCYSNPMTTLYLKTGQTIADLTKPYTTTIEYK